GGLRRVGRAIRDGDISIEPDYSVILVGARYDWQSNRMTVGYQIDLGFVTNRSIILHEGVHALLDLNRCLVSQSVSESAAFLAQTLYLLSCLWRLDGTATPSPLPGYTQRSNPIDDGIFEAAKALALDRRFTLWRGRGVYLSPADYAA